MSCLHCLCYFCRAEFLRLTTHILSSFGLTLRIESIYHYKRSNNLITQHHSSDMQREYGARRVRIADALFGGRGTQRVRTAYAGRRVARRP